MTKRIPLIVLCASIAFFVRAQKGLELGGWIGSSHYFGDLKTEFSLNEPGLAIGLAGRYNFNERISAKASLNLGHLRGDDSDSNNTFERERNLSFKSAIVDLSSQLEFNFLPYVHGSSDDFFTPYIFAGLSGFSFSPRTDLNGTTYSLRHFGTEGQPIGEEYGKFSLAINFGLGVKWDINVDWSMNIEVGMRATSTDYIDDVSTIYPDLDLLASTRGQTAADLSNRSIVPGVGVTGRQRGNSANNDNYVFVGVGIMRYFGQLPCPKIVKDR